MTEADVFNNCCVHSKLLVREMMFQNPEGIGLSMSGYLIEALHAGLVFASLRGDRQ